MQSIKSQIVWAHQLSPFEPLYQLEQRTIELMEQLGYPKIVDAEGSVWMIDDHGILCEGRRIGPTTAPNPWHISSAVAWIAGNERELLRCKSAFAAKMRIDNGTRLYVTNGATLLALSALGYRLAPHRNSPHWAASEMGDLRILHARLERVKTLQTSSI